tara:strand:- start:23 stop:151 length:129 start_codon:yes stop_codon:yes gene_type:complete
MQTEKRKLEAIPFFFCFLIALADKIYLQPGVTVKRISFSPPK